MKCLCGEQMISLGDVKHYRVYLCLSLSCYRLALASSQEEELLWYVPLGDHTKISFSSAIQLAEEGYKYFVLAVRYERGKQIIDEIRFNKWEELARQDFDKLAGKYPGDWIKLIALSPLIEKIEKRKED